MKNYLLGACLAAVLVLSPLAASQPAAADAANGSQVFQAHCAGCHVGGGNVIAKEKTLHREALAANGLASMQAIGRRIAEGQGKMPAFKAFLSPKQIEDVAAYVLDRARKGW